MLSELVVIQTTSTPTERKMQPYTQYNSILAFVTLSPHSTSMYFFPKAPFSKLRLSVGPNKDPGVDILDWKDNLKYTACILILFTSDALH